MSFTEMKESIGKAFVFNPADCWEKGYSKCGGKEGGQNEVVVLEQVSWVLLGKHLDGLCECWMLERVLHVCLHCNR